MPAINTDDPVSLSLGGKAHKRWVSYSIDSNLLVPADAWNVVVNIEEGKVPAAVQRGAPITMRVGDDMILAGRIDGINDKVNKRSHTLGLHGRDMAAVLTDCSAPIFAAQMLTLAEIMERMVRPLGITKVRIDAENARTREKINVEPCDTAWQALQNAAQANGLWPWIEPDGTLVVGGPDYSAPPVASLILRQDRQGDTNVEELARDDQLARSYSEITVLSQTRTTATHSSRPNIRATYKDTSISWYRPKVVVDHEVETIQQAKDRARQLLQDSRLKSFTLHAVVEGQRINAPGEPGHGQLWTPGQRVHVYSEPHDIDEVFFVMGRTFTGGRKQPTLTRLQLKEDGMWIVEAHPHKRRHRRGKNGIGHGQIIDITPP